jgi:hypothetical protein
MIRTLIQALQARKDSHPGRFRPVSFYLLLLIPFILLLSLHTLLEPQAPSRIAFGLSCLFLFFGLALLRALIDLLEILRAHLRETRLSYQETLGEDEFVSKLAARLQESPHCDGSHAD